MSKYYTHYPRTLLWLVRGGAATIGGSEADAAPVYTVEVPSFYISKFPITNEQYKAFDPDYEPDPVSSDKSSPAVGISFDEALAYCVWYSDISRKPMRLPSEIEWEYACRAGSTGQYFFAAGDRAEDYLVGHENFSGQLSGGKSFRPNAFGLYAMLGGVWEWTASRYQPHPLDRKETQKERRRVLRGGSFKTPIEQISCSMRRPAEPDYSSSDVGFRIVKPLSR